MTGQAFGLPRNPTAEQIREDDDVQELLNAQAKVSATAVREPMDSGELAARLSERRRCLAAISAYARASDKLAGGGGGNAGIWASAFGLVLLQMPDDPRPRTDGGGYGMSKMKRWRMPKWMMPHAAYITNTGSAEANRVACVERLYNGTTDPRINLPLSTIEAMCKAQVQLLLRLHDEGHIG